MTAPYARVGNAVLFHGDAREPLPWPDRSVHCIVTSPPYWGLRDYGTATWEGGDPACSHLRTDDLERQFFAGAVTGAGNVLAAARAKVGYRGTCGRCGARQRDSQLGMEATPEEYVANLMACARDWWRLLRDDGVLWLNLGDSYAGRGGQSPQTGDDFASRAVAPGLKNKDLVGIPWRLAFAMQGFALIPAATLTQWADWLCEAREAGDWEAVRMVEERIRAMPLLNALVDAGWYLRSDCIWSKPNPMPESVTDRPTKAHEYVFLLTKAERYFYDGFAVREASATQRTDNLSFQRAASKRGEPIVPGARTGTHRAERSGPQHGAGRNRRTVWEIATKPYPGAHFATFPPELARICILAGTSQRGCCPACGAPWRRVVERRPMEVRASARQVALAVTGLRTQTSGTMTKAPTAHTVGWAPSCPCYDDQYRALPRSRSHRKRRQQDAADRWWRRARRRPGSPEWRAVRCSVYDPFIGSGTTGEVALGLGRAVVGRDLSRAYLDEHVIPRLRDAAGSLFVDAPAPEAEPAHPSLFAVEPAGGAL